MPKDGSNFPFDDDSINNDRDHNSGAEELRQQMEEIYKKLTGENTKPVTNGEILQFLRVVNYNFTSLTRLLQTILLKTAEMDMTLMEIGLDTVRLGTRLQQFFDTNSMLDEIMEGNLNVSGSAPDSKFIV